MKLVAFTETVADLQVRFQVLHMESSAFVWADATSGASSGKSGSLKSLAMTMPPRGRITMPSTTVVLPGPGSGASRRLAEKITRRTGLVIHAHISIPADADALADRIALRLVEELQRGA